MVLCKIFTVSLVWVFPSSCLLLKYICPWCLYYHISFPWLFFLRFCALLGYFLLYWNTIAKNITPAILFANLFWKCALRKVRHWWYNMLKPEWIRSIDLKQRGKKEQNWQENLHVKLNRHLRRAGPTAFQKREPEASDSFTSPNPPLAPISKKCFGLGYHAVLKIYEQT